MAGMNIRFEGNIKTNQRIDNFGIQLNINAFDSQIPGHNQAIKHSTGPRNVRNPLFVCVNPPALLALPTSVRTVSSSDGDQHMLILDFMGPAFL